MRTRPYNKEQALAGKPVVTRDGRKVTRIIHLPEVNREDCKLAAVIDGQLYSFREDGLFWNNAKNPQDLFMLTEPHRELPEGVELPKGYRLLEKGEKIPVGALFYRNDWEFIGYSSRIGSCAQNKDYCYIVPDYETGFWKEGV